jgi:hypothetical protein
MNDSSTSFFPESSDQISNVHRHLIDLCAVVLLDVSQDTYVILAHKVDRHTLQMAQAFLITSKSVNHICQA